jgi:hypothetical protein
MAKYPREIIRTESQRRINRVQGEIIKLTVVHRLRCLKVLLIK